MHFFYMCDLDLDPVTLVHKEDIVIMVTYLHTKIRSIGQIVQNLQLGKPEKCISFDVSNLDLDLGTKHGLNEEVTYLHAKNEVNMSKNVNSWTDRQTGMCKNFTYSLSREIMNNGTMENTFFFC